jgi:hypothetical protein
LIRAVLHHFHGEHSDNLHLKVKILLLSKAKVRCIIWNSAVQTFLRVVFGQIVHCTEVCLSFVHLVFQF